jgi:hypothetical protein
MKEMEGRENFVNCEEKIRDEVDEINEIFKKKKR